MFTVMWSDRAMDQLADIFVVTDLPGQDHLTTLIDGPNRRLARDPMDEGESRTGNYRVTFIGDLTVRFSVDAQSPIVRVNGVRRRGS